MDSEFELKITCFDTMINYHLFQKLKLLEICDFNHLTIIYQNIKSSHFGSHNADKKQKLARVTLESKPS